MKTFIAIFISVVLTLVVAFGGLVIAEFALGARVPGLAAFLWGCICGYLGYESFRVFQQYFSR